LTALWKVAEKFATFANTEYKTGVKIEVLCGTTCKPLLKFRSHYYLKVVEHWCAKRAHAFSPKRSKGFQNGISWIVDLMFFFCIL